MAMRGLEVYLKDSVCFAQVRASAAGEAQTGPGRAQAPRADDGGAGKPTTGAEVERSSALCQSQLNNSN